MVVYLLFFFNDTATTEIYTLSLHDALPIFELCGRLLRIEPDAEVQVEEPVEGLGVVLVLDHGRPQRVAHHLALAQAHLDRKSTRLNSSHANISYAVFCLKKKKTSDFIYNNH